MRFTHNKNSGFTIIEIVLVLTILAILFGLSMLYYQTTQVRADLNAQISNFVGLTRLAQSSAEAGLNGTSHGVHLDEDRYIIFAGDIYDADDPSNYEVVLPPTITIDEYVLNDGGSTVLFSPPNGSTNDYGTIVFLSEQINQSKTITITNAGSIYY